MTTNDSNQTKTTRMHSAIYKDTRKSHRKDRFSGPKYPEGTRVAERPKYRFDACSNPAGYKKAALAAGQRYGVVISNEVKVMKGKNKSSNYTHRRVYVTVQWDHLKSPMVHDQQRICTIEEFEQLKEITRLTIGG